MRIYGGVNPYDSHRFGFGYVDTIQRQDTVTPSRNQISASENPDQSIRALQQVMQIREAVQAIKPMMLDPEVNPDGVRVADVTQLVVESIVEENADKPWEQEPVAKPTPVTDANGPMLTTLVGNMAKAMNTLFDDTAFKGSPGAFLEGVRDSIRTAVSTSFDSQGARFNTDFGIHFDFSNNDGRVFNFSPDDQHRFETSLATQEGAASIRNALFGTESNGLFNQLHSTLTAAASDLEREAGSTGIFVDELV